MNDDDGIQGIKYDVYSYLLDEIKKALEQTGIRSLLSYIYLILKHFGQSPPIQALNFDMYSQKEKLTDKQTLDEMHECLKLTLIIFQKNSLNFHIGEQFTIFKYVINKTSDKYRCNDKYVSYQQKRNAVARKIFFKKNGYELLLDKAEESKFSKPCYFVAKKNNCYYISIRGTSNQDDKLLDIDTKPIKDQDYYLHQGFYRHAQEIYQEMEEYRLLDQDAQYFTTGYSMGGAVSCILAYLIYSNFTQNVRSYGFGSGCSGCVKFNEYSKQFCTTIINGYDMIPQMTVHGLYTQLQRLLFQNNKRFYKNKLLKRASKSVELIEHNSFKLQHHDINDELATLDISKVQAFETFKQNPLTHQISEICTNETDLFVGGEVYHSILGEFIHTDVHDLGELFLSAAGFVEHYTYPWLLKEIDRLNQKYNHVKE